ncbi:MAG: hypothetical protein KAH20_13825, partial [Methylococcales bacterium]|nr:hypothetical protein [Methylococcales bacterium]
MAFNFFDLIPIQQISEIDKTSVVVKLNEMKARLLWITSTLVYFFITIGFEIFIWKILKNSITKSTLIFFIILAISVPISF